MVGRISRMIGKLTVGRKLALIYLLDLSAVIFISGILINEKYIAIDFSRKEMAGNDYIAAIRDALLPLARAQADAAGSAAAIELAERQFGSDMRSAELSREFSALLRQSGNTPVATDDGIAPSPAFVAGRALLTRVGNQSNLILDPDLDSYYTMSLVILRFPELLEVINSTRALALQLATAEGAQRQRLQTQFLILEGRMDATMGGIGSDYTEAFAASTPLLRQHLDGSRAALQQAVAQFRASTQALAGAPVRAAGSAALLRHDAAASAALLHAWREAEGELHRLIQLRVDGFFTRMWLHLGTAVLLLVMILGLVFFVARQIALPIRRLARVAQEVRETGDHSLRAIWDSEDETGRLVSAFQYHAAAARLPAHGAAGTGGERQRGRCAAPTGRRHSHPADGHLDPPSPGAAREPGRARVAGRPGTGPVGGRHESASPFALLPALERPGRRR